MLSKQLNGKCQIKGYVQKGMSAPFIFSGKDSHAFSYSLLRFVRCLV